ncbi:MAG: hypothetical protein JWP44_2792 [Mucilaginibacter sp.]|nr:hypothetical protein [Mucilaginibacter sp.]
MIKSLKHLSYILKFRENDLDVLTDNISNYYYRKDEQKFKDGKPKIKNGMYQIRVMYPSTGKLKRIQNQLNRTILNNIKLPNYAHGSIKKRDNITNAKCHVGKKYMFQTDLKAFFPSINYKLVYEMFISHGFSPDVASRLTKLTTFKDQVPQGAPTSSIIANLVFVKTGDKIAEFAKKHGLTFTTYVDDITLSSAKCFHHLTNEILQIMTNDGYFISHDKTNYKAGNKNVTGVAVGQNGISITDSFKIKIKAETDITTPRYAGLVNYKKRVFSFNSSRLALQVSSPS